jgi:ATP-dependent nuclease, subunit B
MKLRLFSSFSSDSAAADVIGKLKDLNLPGSRHVFIAPDRFTLSFEKEIFERLGSEGASNIEVFSFTRLALKTLGPRAEKCLSKEGAVVVLKKAVERVKDKLSRYSLAANSASFAKEMFAVVASVRNGGYSPEDLEEAIPKLNRSTGSKAHDIALIYRAYLEELSSRADSTSRLEAFIKEAGSSDYIKNAHVYVAGFPSFTAKQYEILSALLKSARSLNVAVTPDNGGESGGLCPAETFERLKDTAEFFGITPEIYVSEPFFTEPFASVGRALFSYSGKKIGSRGKIILYREKNVFEEISGVALEILRLVRKNNYRFRDISVVTCAGDYDYIISEIFGRFDVSVFVDQKYKLSETALARHLLSAAEAAVFNCRRDKALDFIKSPLFGRPPAGFENFVLKHNIDYAAFLRPFDAFGEEGAECEPVRKELASAVSLFSEAKDLRAAFSDFLARAAEKNQIFIESLSDEPLLQEANSQAGEKLKALIEEAGGLLGGAGLPEFYEAVKSAVGAEEISLIPRFADSVFVGKLTESRFTGAKAVFVVFATADALPSLKSYRAILSSADAEILKGGGVRLFPTPESLMAEERFLITELFFKGAEAMYLGFSVSSPDGGETRPSAVVAELGETLSLSPVSLYEKFSPGPGIPFYEVAGSLKNAYFGYLSSALRIPKDNIFQNAYLDAVYGSLSPGERERADQTLFPKEETFLPPQNFYFPRDTSESPNSSAISSARGNII